MRDENFDNAVTHILEMDARYPRKAYEMIAEILALALRRQAEERRQEATHVSGKELAYMLRDYFSYKFGPFAETVLNACNIHSTDDIGELVFNLIKVGIFGANKGDSKQDFHALFDFDEAFRKPYLPRHPVPDFRPRRPSKKKDA